MTALSSFVCRIGSPNELTSYTKEQLTILVDKALDEIDFGKLIRDKLAEHDLPGLRVSVDTE